jgi:undecaprenyl-diphosphatase
MEFIQATDEGALFWFENHHAPWLDEVMRFFTFLGNSSTMFVVVPVAMLGFWLWKRPRSAGILLATALLAMSLSEAVKWTIQRPRPEVAWRRTDLPKQPSFPSGHALNSMADYAAIGLLASLGLRRRGVRYLVIAAGLILPVLIGASRPYLGVHYPTDVLGGWTAGLACALLGYWAELRWGDRAKAEAPAKSSIVPSMPSESVIPARDVTGFQKPF